MWGLKHPAQEIWGLFPLDGTEQVPCLSFPLSHRRRMQRWGEWFPSWQFKEERSHSMNYLWICCRGLVSFTHSQGPSSGTEVSPVWILQGLIRVVFTTAAFVGGHGSPSSTACVFLWNVKYSEPSVSSSNYPKGVEQGTDRGDGSTSLMATWNNAETWHQARAPEEALPCKAGRQQRYLPRQCATLQ